MTSIPSSYTNLFPKRGDIMGTSDQAFGCVKGVLTYLIGGIKAKTIAAIGTIAPGTTIVQYQFTPTIHHDLGSVPKMIIGSQQTQ